MMMMLMQLVVQFVTSPSANSLSTKQFIYLYTASVIPLISMEIYLLLNAKVLQGNSTVLSILHLLKGLISSRRNFQRTIAQSAIFSWCLKQLKDSILKFQISESFFSQKAFWNQYTVVLVSFPSGACVEEVVGNQANYNGYKDDVYFLQYNIWAVICFMNQNYS